MNATRTVALTLLLALTLAPLHSQSRQDSVDLTRTDRVVELAADAAVAGGPQRIATRERVERETIAELIADHRPSDETLRARLTEAILEQSLAVGLDPLLVAAIAARESSFRSGAVSRAGAVGLMQIRPFVGRDLAVRDDLTWNGVATLHEPESNIRLGALYYRELQQRFAGNVELALAAYHRGPTRLQRQLEAGRYAGSAYAERVRSLYAALDRHRASRLDA